MDRVRRMPAKKNRKSVDELTGKALVKEVNRRIRLARKFWAAHNNKACRRERDRAMELYEKLGKAEREQVPQVLRVWLRYRSEKYFGDHRTKPGTKSAPLTQTRRPVLSRHSRQAKADPEPPDLHSLESDEG